MPKGLKGFQKGNKNALGKKFALGYHHTEDAKRRIREAQKNKIPYIPTEEVRQRISNTLKGKMVGEKNGYWKGENVGYSGLHKYIGRMKGKPTECSYCGDSGREVRYYHWANISLAYTRDLDDWVRLCAKCHILYDMGLITLNGTNNNNSNNTGGTPFQRLPTVPRYFRPASGEGSI